MISVKYIAEVVESHFIKAILKSKLSLDSDRNGHMTISVENIDKNQEE